MQEAIDLGKQFTQQATIETIPIYGSMEKQGYVGFPVRRVTFKNGQPDKTTELVEFKREAIPPAALEVPAGYVKVGQ